MTNELDRYAHAFDDIEPWSGIPARGTYRDWLGAVTDARFRAYLGIKPDSVGGTFVSHRRPMIEDGEGWFESVNQVEAAREARGSLTMITLGACYGAQAVGSYLALQKLNPMPVKLVAVEPEPENLRWVAQHFRDNGIDPRDHWLVGCAITDTNEPVFFPVGAPGSGAQNSFATNEAAARESYVQALIDSGRTEEALRNLLLHNTTGLGKRLLSDTEFDAEITMMSSVTLYDVLAPFTMVDYLEVDIQQSEIIVFPPYMDFVTRKVRRVHLGTHGRDVHHELARLFRERGWEIIFDFEPNNVFETSLGRFGTNDGVLTARNPRF